ncbi:MAG: hypothetical protein QM401_04255 [Bacillota bacterium]|nr:hypothetical protein [Bacillota bacterium]
MSEKYERLEWLDEVKDQDGKIIQKGTPLSARNMNRMEAGITEALEIGEDLEGRVEHLESTRVKRYGVVFNGSNPVGERVEDAVGMVANVAVDDEIVVNDFDEVPFFNRRICCGHFDDDGNFHVHAYRGEPGFDWYGSNGEVYYEETPFGWKGDLHTYVSVCGSPVEGYQLAPRFRNWVDKEYSPVFWSSTVEGKATSRSGLFADYDSLNGHMASMKATHGKAHTETMASLFTDWLLLLVEFATKDLQTVMMGASSMAYASDSYKAVIAENDTNRIVMTAAGANRFVVGQTISIGSSYATDNVAKDRLVTSIIPVDDELKAVHFDGPAVNIAVGNEAASRTWKNGVTNIIRASSGSIVSNTDGRYPCIWRGKVDPWGGAYSAICDVLVQRTGEDPDYIYTPHYLPDPTKYAAGVITGDYIPLNYEIAGVSGYVTELGRDDRYPHVMLPTAVGGSSTTYFSDHYYYPSTPNAEGVTAVWAGGPWTSGRHFGPFMFYARHSPASSHISRRARLFVSRA